MYYLIKILITSLVVVAVSELGKRYSPMAAILASLPLTSILAMIWLYWDTKDVAKIGSLSTNIFWAVLPSLLFFITVPILLKLGFNFGVAMAVSIVLMACAYGVYSVVLAKFGIAF